MDIVFIQRDKAGSRRPLKLLLWIHSCNWVNKVNLCFINQLLMLAESHLGWALSAGGGGGVGGVRSLLKFSSGYAPVSTGLTNSIYHRKKDLKVTLNPPSHSTKSYTRRLRPEVQPIILWYTIFDRNGTPFVYLILTNDTLFSYLTVRVRHPF